MSQPDFKKLDAEIKARRKDKVFQVRLAKAIRDNAQVLKRLGR